MPVMNKTPKNRFFLFVFNRAKSFVTVLKRKKGMSTVARISTSICIASCSLRKLYGCKRMRVVKEKRSRVTSTTDRDVRLKRMCKRFMFSPATNYSECFSSIEAKKSLRDDFCDDQLLITHRKNDKYDVIHTQTESSWINTNSLFP